MKYCGRYSNKIKMSVFDEVAIVYDRQSKEVINYLEANKSHNTVLIVRDIKDFHSAKEWIKLNAIKTQYPDFQFSVCFNEVARFSPFSEELIECVRNITVPFFTGYLATNFDQLHYLCKQGVSDVYIAEDICFDLMRARRVASSYGVKLRAFPNVGQSSVKQGPALKKFFIRPEDVAEYEDCIDILEFWGPLDRQKTLHEIYTKGVWFGDLKELILDFDLSFDSRRIIPGFARLRKTCGRKCMKGERCGVCDRILSISKVLEDKDLIIKQKKNT